MPPPQEGDAWMTAQDLANLTRLAKRTLDNMRQRGDGPPYYIVHQRARYLRSEVWAWLESSHYQSTSEYGRKPAVAGKRWPVVAP
jgi:hypothetical protein